MSSDFITAFHTTVVRPQSGDPGGQRVGGARVAQTRVGRRSTPQQNPALQATGMCRPINYTAIFEAMPKLPEWIADAPCSQADPELFFPGPHEWAIIALAKQVCAACPVRQECLEWALDRGEKFGIYGGLTSTQRREVLRQRTKEAAA